ncbi:MAG: glycerol-3-phosphate acyltransferase [Candidatus Cloacimonetes bacterium]|nr:glycerol-3-phosphate acyltransferase [Candidatus Cloacimonadota bacterium]HNZ07509.1 glycerol-3-phosphate acyltransferase [Candidatus Cloacimonadota bacterium]HPN41129.1 glycerol-3-phosphate acyltransferase [Candidatus Cloacimonadota bacterium]
MIHLLALGIVIIAYMYGCFSTARIIAKSFRSLDIYKVGTGLADTENIYSHISRPLGVLVGGLDVAKAYLFMKVVELLLILLSGSDLMTGVEMIYAPNYMLVYGLAMLVGHCLPVTHRWKGGRGIFTYTGFMVYFAFWPMIITLVIAWLLIAIYKQIRFAQYLIVILPVILAQVFYSFIPYFRKELPPYFIGMMLGVALFMGILNFVVSKKLGEL